MSKENLEIKYPAELSRELLENLARTYAQVFRKPPWNEAVKCSECQRFAGEETPIDSPCQCGGTFKEAYPLDETVAYITKESQKPDFKIAVVEDEKQIVGFSWSYLTTPSNLTASKWSTSEGQQRVAQLLTAQDLQPDSIIRYQSETGVDYNYRGRGLGTELRRRVEGTEVLIERTNRQSPMMRINGKLGLEQIMGLTTTGKTINCLDPENPQRALFIKRRQV